MFISIREVEMGLEGETALLTEQQAVHAGLRGRTGFRWAMLLRSLERPNGLLSVAMWQTPSHAADAEAPGEPPANGYDVVTARGAMTPAAFALLTRWQIEATQASGFVNAWNAAFSRHGRHG